MPSLLRLLGKHPAQVISNKNSGADVQAPRLPVKLLEAGKVSGVPSVVGNSHVPMVQTLPAFWMTRRVDGYGMLRDI